MTQPDKQKAARMSRREMGRAVVATMAGALAASAGPGMAQAPEKPAPETPMDTRVARIEKSRGKPLTEEQRKAVLAGIQGTDDAWEKGRAGFDVPDGTEPGFVFRPVAPDPVKR